MEIKKKIIGKMSKCYAIASLEYNKSNHILIGAEKQGPILLYDLEGNLIDTVCDGPGGVMTMEQIPGSNGEFLSTQEFYSPNDSANARIVYIKPSVDETWEIHTLVNLPFVHRFGVVERNGIKYLIAATIKSAHAYKDDWSSPGCIWVSPLPDNLSQFNEQNQLELYPLKGELFHNHGFFKVAEKGYTSVLIGSDNGVLKVRPPEVRDGEWEVEEIIKSPTSDMLLIDFDLDGELELLTLSPFHGKDLSLYKKIGGTYEEVFKYSKPLPFLHAIWPTKINEKPAAIIGHRQGECNLLLVTCDDSEKLSLKVEVLDTNVGPANAYSYQYKDKHYIVSTNHGIDEIALYQIKSI